jgi:Domain of unknown function (DUF4340)
MKNQTTALWLALALALGAGIWLSQKFLRPAASMTTNLLSGFHAGEMTAIQISPAGVREIAVLRTNGAWVLQKPLAYPAQATAVDTLAAALEKIAPALRLTAGDMRSHKNAEADFGFDNPQFSLVVAAGEQRWQLLIGNKTAPGDQVFIRLVGFDGAFVTDANWLQLLPRSADAWRDTALADAAAVCDWLVITNGTKTMEFRQDATNHLWQMLRPLPARADGERIAAALQKLRGGRVTRFVTDDARADLGGYGLQPTELSVWLGRGTNFIGEVHAGKISSENANQIFARREGWNSVLLADKDAFAPWRGAVNDFRDSHLLAPTAPVAEIEVRGENHFTLQQRGANDWSVAGEKFPADAENVRLFLKTLNGLRVSEFVKDVVTLADLQGFGLATPAREISLRTTAGDTNSTVAELLFGAVETNRVLVKRGDEDFVYALKPEDLVRLPEAGWEFREHRIWNFSEASVAQVTLRQGGKLRQLVRTGDNKWSLGTNSQGIINPPAVEETLHRLGELTAAGWVGRNLSAPEKYGLDTNNLSISVELKSSEKLNLDFGAELPRSQTALAAVTLDGERWAFVFPPVLYQFIVAYLTIPTNAP